MSLSVCKWYFLPPAKAPSHVNAQNPPQASVVIRQVVESVIVRIEAQAHHPQNQDLPEVHPRAARLPLIPLHGFFYNGFFYNG